MPLLRILPPDSTETYSLQNIYEYLVLGSIADTEGNLTNNFSNIELTISGRQRQNIRNTVLLKLINLIISNNSYSDPEAAVFPQANILHCAIGGMGNVQTELKITNPNATQELKIFGFSTAKNAGAVVRLDESRIVANSSEDYQGFEALAFQTIGFESAQIEFEDGWSDKLTLTDLTALLQLLTKTTIIGSGGIAIDNRLGIIKTVRLYTDGAGGNGIQVLEKSYEAI